MKIAINCRSFLLPEHTGIGRYTQHLVDHLAKIDQSNEYVLYARKHLFDRRRKAPRPLGSNFQVRLDVLGRGIDQIIGDADIYHAPSPEYLHTKHRKIIVSVHDMIHRTFPQSQTPSTVRLMEEYFEDIVDKACKIICCSQSTRHDLHQTFDIDPARSCVIYNGVNQDAFYEIDQQELREARDYLVEQKINKPFVLFVGTIEPRKNLKNLLHAFHQLKEKKQFDGYLVVAGMKGWMSDDIAPLVRSLGLSDDIIFTGFVSDAHLRWLYNCCHVFVFPSFYEGFGFPILEAFRCGATVITSNTSSCAEIAGDAAYIVDPNSVEDLSDRLFDALTQEEDNAALKQKAFQRAQQFSFQKNAEETLAVYHQVNGM